jgi:hypothetical protein
MIAFWSILAGIALASIIILPIVLFGGWIVMLCLGALAHIFGPAATFLAVGYWQSCLVALIFAVLF